MIETFVILMWKYNYNNAEMVDTTMKAHHTSVGVGRVCGLSPSEWGLPAKVFCFASIFVNKWTDVLAIFDIFHNHVILILKTSR